MPAHRRDVDDDVGLVGEVRRRLRERLPRPRWPSSGTGRRRRSRELGQEGRENDQKRRHRVGLFAYNVRRFRSVPDRRRRARRARRRAGRGGRGSASPNASPSSTPAAHLLAFGRSDGARRRLDLDRAHQSGLGGDPQAPDRRRRRRRPDDDGPARARGRPADRDRRRLPDRRRRSASIGGDRREQRNDRRGHRRRAGGPRRARVKRFADHYTYRFDVAPEALWRAVSDTDAINRDAGLADGRATPSSRGPEAVRRRSRTLRFGPLAVEWEEPPLHLGGAVPRLGRAAVPRRAVRAVLQRRARRRRRRRLADRAHASSSTRAGPSAHCWRRSCWRAGGPGRARAYERAAERAKRIRTGSRAAAGSSVPELPPAGIPRVDAVRRRARSVAAAHRARARDRGAPGGAGRARRRYVRGADAAVRPCRRLVDAARAGAGGDAGVDPGRAAGPLLDAHLPELPRPEEPRRRRSTGLGGDVHCDQCGIDVRGRISTVTSRSRSTRRPSGRRADGAGVLHRRAAERASDARADPRRRLGAASLDVGLRARRVRHPSAARPRRALHRRRPTPARGCSKRAIDGDASASRNVGRARRARCASS